MGAPLPGWHKFYAPQDYTSPEDLRGLRIAVAQGTAQDFVTRTFLTDGGLNPDTDVELVSLPSLFEIIGAMKSGRVDAAWIWGQGVEQLGDDPKFSFVADDGIVAQSTTAMLAASRTYVEENPEASAAILRALVKAADFTQNDIEGAAQIVAGGISGDAAAIAKVIEGQNFGISFNADSMASFVAKYAFLTAADKLDPTYNLADYINLDLLRVAMPDGDIVAAVE
jgi:NitT/TauT family transport system substrate-binding protein